IAREPATGEWLGAAPVIGRGCASWYAVQTQVRREDVAEISLQRAGVRVFCPRYRRKAILHGYLREVVRPLFPGYLFAGFDSSRELRAVHYSRGVRGVVMFGGEAVPVADSIIADIESRMTDGCVRLQPSPLRPGQRVEITAGPLQGFAGVFQHELSDTERVAILLDTLTYNARV
ncbi:MAG: hypothetical protein A3J75_06505, partial [Acidobacteria bacterium RBG_16_68_9]